MADAKNNLTVHVTLELQENYVSPEEMQLVSNQLAELIGQVLRMDEMDEV